jgi:hypothetical protein
VGRDYSDVPPTRGVFKGDASSELTVAVRVAPSDKPPQPEVELESEDWSAVLQSERTEADQIAAEQRLSLFNKRSSILPLSLDSGVGFWTRVELYNVA